MGRIGSGKKGYGCIVYGLAYDLPADDFYSEFMPDRLWK
jgi:hypothetical protein